MERLCPGEFDFVAESRCRYMDISLGFQWRLMWCLPLAIFIFAALAKFVMMFAIEKTHSRITKHRVDLLSVTKLALILIQIGSIASVLHYNFFNSSPATAAYALQLVSSILLVPLSYAQHTRAYAPSTLISAHLATASLFSATQLRSLVNAGVDGEDFFAGYCVFFASTCCLFFAELIEKRWLMKSSMKPKATETTSSIPSRILFTFLYPVLYSGFRKSLNLDDVNDFGLPEELSSNDATKRFTKLLYSSRKVSKSGKETQPILMPSILAFYEFFFAAVIPKLLYVAVTFAQPFLVSTILSFIDSYATEGATPQDPNIGWGLVGAYAIVYLSLAATTALYWDKVYAMVIRYRAALVSVLFDKSVRLASSVAENQGRGSAVTYMSVDVERVVEGVIFFHECWSALVSIACAAVILWYKASYAMIPPLCVMIGFFGVTSIVGKKVSGAQKRWMGSTEGRLAVIGSVMQQIIPTKLLGLEPVMPTWINPLRAKEVENLKAFYRRLVIVVVLSSATINCAGLSALGTFAGISGDIRPQTLFTIYTIVNLVTLPISTVGHCFPLLVASWASMKRIAGFLLLEEKPVSLGGELPNSERSSTESLKYTSTEKSTSLDEKSDRGYDGPPALWGVNASASSEPGAKSLISDIDINFPSNKLSIVVGPVGSGKSILLKTLLGETHLQTGRRKVPGGATTKISYAPQEAFIWPTSVRENIVLDSEYDYDWYNKVVESCALFYDFKRMSKGDLTQLTEKGGGVSGGQKQRISLARALYASRHTSFVVLDDCFSALDAHTTKHVFNALFGSSGILRTRTVVMVTHSHKHLTAADFVAAMEGGSILAKGSLRELYKNVIDIKNYIGEIPKELEEDNEINEVKPETEEEEILNELGDPALVEKPSHHHKSMDGKDYEAVDTEENPDEEDASANLGWTPYKFYMRHCGWARLSVCVVFLIFYNAVEVGLQIYLEKWSSANTTDHRPWLGGYAGFTVAAFISSFCMMWMYTQYTAPRASLGMHEQMLNNVLDAPVTYFQKTSSALLINRWGSDMFISDFAFPISMLDVSLTAVYVVGAAILILIAVPWLAIAVPVLAVIYWSLQRVYLATSRQLQRLTISSKTPLYTSFSTLLTGLVTIRAFKSTAMFKEISELHLNRSQAPMYYRDSGIRFLRTFLNLVTAFIAIGIASIAVGLRNSTSAGYLGVALSQLVSMATSLTNLLLAWTRVENGVVSLERIVEITQLESEESAHARDAEETGKALPAPTEPSVSWPESGAVEYRDVTLKYTSSSPRNALDHLNISLPAGHKLGICGRTGSGKSSTIYALLRGQPLTAGSIFVDGVDLATVPLHTLRSRISTISQDPFLLHASIAENLSLGCPEETTDDDIWQALRDVGMAKQVDALENKLETQVTTDGMEFSAGERQLLCIARVLLQKRKIVILDEASSSMDGKTDERLLNLLKTALSGITVISVAHRISTISEYDQVIVMDEGRVMESDSPTSLLTNTSSELYKLAYNQGMMD